MDIPSFFSHTRLLYPRETVQARTTVLYEPKCQIKDIIEFFIGLIQYVFYVILRHFCCIIRYFYRILDYYTLLLPFLVRFLQQKRNQLHINKTIWVLGKKPRAATVTFWTAKPETEWTHYIFLQEVLLSNKETILLYIYFITYYRFQIIWNLPTQVYFFPPQLQFFPVLSKIFQVSLLYVKLTNKISNLNFIHS